MFRRSVSSLLLAGLLFADGSWLGRLEQLFFGSLWGERFVQATWATSEWGASIDPNGQPLQPAPRVVPGGGDSHVPTWGASIDPNG